MKVLLIGSGGREHALAWKIDQSKKLTKLYIIKGNAGTSQHGENVNIDQNDFEKVGQFVIEKKIELVIVGPEEPLVKGFHDYFLSTPELKNIPVIGPQTKGAMLEGSKDFSKQFMIKYNIPTAKYKSFTKTTITEACQFLETLDPPYVLKADGLAAGKGVLIIDNIDKAKNELAQMMDGKFGDAGNTVVIEEHLKGIENSVFVVTDGKNYKILPEAKDYKRIGEGDTGLNTGGMGAISPVPFADSSFIKKVEDRIIKPTIDGLQKEGIPYCGFIFLGLMTNDNGDPFMIEYNVRMGDPESEVVIPRIKTDLLEIFEAMANGTLDKISLEIDDRTAVTVMLVSGGYPGNYEKGKEIFNLEKVDGSIVFHAGTNQQNGKIFSNGGRVIAVTSFGNNMDEALAKSYKNADLIEFEGKYFRKDIGFDL